MTLPALPPGLAFAPSADHADIDRLLAGAVAELPRGADGTPIATSAWWRQQQQRRPHAFAQSALTMTPAEYRGARSNLRYAALSAAEDAAAEQNLQRIAARQASRPWRKGTH